MFKNCALFTSCISKINNTQVDDVQHIDVLAPIYDLIEHSDNYSKISGILRQYCRDQPVLNDDGEITNFTEANATTTSFNFNRSNR